MEALRHEVQAVRDRNLDEASFAERLDLVISLGVKVYPAEDLHSMRVTCRLGREDGPGRAPVLDSPINGTDGEPEAGCGKVTIAPA